MYVQDSFFTLSAGGQAGLAALSVLLALAVIAAVRRIARGRRWPVRIAVGLILFWGFVWLSPQLYYLYYMAIIDGLPLQWVVRAPPGPADLGRLLSFSGAATLSAHSQGVLGWGVMAASLLRNRPLRRNAAN